MNFKDWYSERFGVMPNGAAHWGFKLKDVQEAYEAGRAQGVKDTKQDVKDYTC